MNEKVKRNRIGPMNMSTKDIGWGYRVKSNRGEVIEKHSRQGIFIYFLSKVCLHRCSGLSMGMARAVSTRVVRLDKPFEEGKWFWVGGY